MKKSAVGLMMAMLSHFASPYSYSMDFPIVSVTKGSRVIWLVGSWHLGSKPPTIPRLMSDLIASSNGICFEYDPNNPAAGQRVQERISLNEENEPLSKKIGKDLYRKVSQKLAPLYPPQTPVDMLSPFIIAAALPRTIPDLDRFYSTLSIENSLDARIEQQARILEKPLYGFENPERLVQAIDRMTNADWQTYIKGILAGLECAKCRDVLTQRLTHAYHGSSDPEYAFTNLNASLSWNPVLQRLQFKVQFQQRNKDFVDSIQLLAFEKPQCDIFVMGAAHLGGSDGVLRMLITKGYKISATSSTH